MRLTQEHFVALLGGAPSPKLTVRLLPTSTITLTSNRIGANPNALFNGWSMSTEPGHILKAEQRPLRILLFGKGGQVATELAPLLANLGELQVLGPSDCDFSKPATIEPLILRFCPHVIVNAAAYTAVDKAESELDVATSVNALAVGVIGSAARSIGALVIHYSTDYVFDGTSELAYTEGAQPNPLSVYGRTKLESEQLLRDSGADHMIFRTAWVYSSVGSNFVKTMLRLNKAGTELRIVGDQHGTPTSAKFIAAATHVALQTWVQADLAHRSQLLGTFHLVANGSCSWFEFAGAIFRSAAAAGFKLNYARISKIETSEYPTPAARPKCVLLDNTKFRTTFEVLIPDWNELLDPVLRELFAKSIHGELQI